MRRIAVVAALSALTLACVEGGTIRYRFIPGVDVPKTPEGGVCVRQCMGLLTNSCAMTGTSSTQVTKTLEGTATHVTVETSYAIGPHTDKLGCPGLYSDCLLTCPGAVQTPEGPRVERESSAGVAAEDGQPTRGAARGARAGGYDL